MRKGCEEILDWNDKMMKTSHYDVDPMWTVMREGGPEHCRGQLKSYMERLKGYSERVRNRTAERKIRRL